MKRYEVGDRVRIREDIREIDQTQVCGYAVVGSMLEKGGEVYTIDHIVTTEDDEVYEKYLKIGGPVYYLEGDFDGWKWQAFMFDPIFDKEISEEVVSAYSELFGEAEA